MKKYILSIDQGTTSSRAILFNHDGILCFSSSKEVKCLYPHQGWVEADALSIFTSVIDCVVDVMVKNNIAWNEVDSVGITNQRETTIVWDKRTGQPVYNAIIWQSRQTAEICDRYIDKKEEIHEKTGLLINPYFSASKIRFILDNIPNGQKRAEQGDLLFGTVDSWLIYKLTNGKVHATDVTNASRTLLFNIHEMKWDKSLCKLFNIPMTMLPDVKPSSYYYGNLDFFKTDLAVQGVAGDQQAALFGQVCFNKGDSKNTYGTGCFMLMNTGKTPVLSKKGLLTTIAWQIKDEVYYALEGSVFIGGAVVQWLRDEMKLISKASESENHALACESTHGVYIVPAFVGLGTPYWDDDARGAVFGLSRGSNKDHFIRASLDSIAYQCKDVFDVMKKEGKCKLCSLKVDGGATANHYLMQFQSDLLRTNIMLPKCLETTALGVCYLAGLNSGFYKSMDDIKKIHCYQNIYEPNMNLNESKSLYKGWKKAVKVTRLFK